MNSKILSIYLLAVVFCFAAASAASAATITVNTLTDENNTNAAACSLREAINNANNDNASSGSGCTAGSGTDNIVIGVNGTITPTSVLPTITTSMNITGNGAGLLTVTGSNAWRIFTINGGTVSINNLTAANGFDSSQAGAIYNSGSATTLSGVVVTNSRSGQGGGIQNDTTMTINNSTISNNRGTNFAGGIVNFGTMTVSGSTFSGNQSASDGGGINNGGSLTVSDSTFANNSANSPGSGIAHFGTAFSVTRSTFTGNLLSSAIIISATGVSNISNSTFFNNFETPIEAFSDFTLTNSTITGNRSDGGAVVLQDGSFGALVNNIVAGNTESNGTTAADIRLLGGFLNTSASFNNIVGTGGTGGLTNGTNGNQTNVPLANIRLLPLGNYGGLVQTMPIRTNSPALNAGRNTGAPATDARGYSRPQGGTVDIGSFEIQANSIVTSTLNNATGSLRDVVAAVPANEVVQFAVPLFNTAQTISLSGGQITIGKNLTIYGNGANILNVRNTQAASTSSRVFLINSGFTVNLTGMTVSGGNLTGTTGGATDGDGGGIYNNGGNLTLNGVVVDGNTATFRAGGIGGANGSLTILNSAVVNNVLNGAGTGGAGLYTLNQIVVLTNSTFSGNRATGGTSNAGGIRVGGASNNTTITNCTIANNSISDTSGFGGVANGNGTTTVRNSIIASNVNNANVGDVGGTFVSGGFNIIGNRGAATGFTQPTDQTGTSALFENADADNLAPAAVLDPRLLILTNNGGTVPTHALNGASPAIDKGNSFGVTTDARGLPRPVDLASYANAAGGNGADIGAFEAQLAPTAASVSISGKVITQGGAGLVNALVYLTDSQGVSRSFKTGTFGNYQFENVRAGETYTIVVVSKKYRFDAQVLTVSESIADLNFIAVE